MAAPYVAEGATKHHRINPIGNLARRILLRLYYSSYHIYRSPICCGRLRPPQTKLQILVLGLEGSGKTTFCLKLCGHGDHEFNNPELATRTFCSQGTLTFVQEHKPLCSRPTIIRYVEIGGNPPFSQNVDNLYAQAHAVILLLDASNDHFLLKSEELISSLINNKFLKKKPFLVVLSKTDLCRTQSAKELIKALNLSEIASEAQTHVMTMTFSTETKKDDLVKHLTWFIEHILQNQDEIMERIEIAMNKLDHSQEERETQTLLEKLVAKSARATQTGTGNDNIEECKVDICEIEDQLKVNDTDESLLDKNPVGEVSFEEETPEVIETDEVNKFLFLPFGQPPTTSIETESSWIEELGSDCSESPDEDVVSVIEMCVVEPREEDTPPEVDGDGPCFQKSKCLNNFSRNERLSSSLLKEAKPQHFPCDEGDNAEDIVHPFPKFETGLDIGPDLFSSPVGHVGGGEATSVLNISFN